MNKIKILFLITDLGRGGAERFLVDHCSGLSEYKHIEFIIASLYDNNQYTSETTEFKIVNLECTTFSFWKKNENLNFKDLLNTFKPNIIHTNRYLAEFISSYYVRDDIKYVCHAHDNMIEFKNFSFKTIFNKTKLLNWVEKNWLYFYKYRKVNTYFIANSNHTYSYYNQVLPNCQKNNLRKLNYGFRFDKFYNPENRRTNHERNLQLLNIGSFQHKKNQTFLIDIARELKKKMNNFEIHLLGAGEFFDEVSRRVKIEKLDGHIFLHGIVDNVQDWYKKSDIYLHTAYYEPFGLVFLEAMAAGLPIVCLDGQGNRDIIEHGNNGFIFGEQNPKLFADAIFELSEDNSKYEKMSNYGKSFAKKFDIEIQTDKFVEFYKSILAKK
jgi:glycosyltransferase involved in cell wall biosynthesis